LPRYPAIAYGEQHIYPHELATGSDVFRRAARTAYESHTELEASCAELAAAGPDARSTNIAFYSTGHATPSRAEVVGSELVVEKRDPEWLPNVGLRGDGTVPAISAIPIEHSSGEASETARRFAPESHVTMASSDRLIELLVSLAFEDTSAVRGTAPTGPWVGFDVDEVVAVGHPTTISLQLNGALESDSIPRLAVRGPDDSAAPLQMTTSGSGREWSSTFVPEREGVYRVTAFIENVGHYDVVSGSEAFGAYAHG
jgi:hypothetical protein